MRDDAWKPWIEIVDNGDVGNTIESLKSSGVTEIELRLVGSALSCAKWHPSRSIVRNPYERCGICISESFLSPSTEDFSCLNCIVTKVVGVYCCKNRLLDLYKGMISLGTNKFGYLPSYDRVRAVHEEIYDQCMLVYKHLYALWRWDKQIGVGE